MAGSSPAMTATDVHAEIPPRLAGDARSQGLQALQTVLGRKAARVVMRFVEGLLRLRDLVRQHLRGEIFQRNRMFGDDYCLAGSDVRESAAQEKLLLRAAGLAGCQNAG